MNEVFLKAAPLLSEIEKAGFEAFFVGGSVRDYLLGNEIADVDITTSATPEEIKMIFPKTIDVGIEHGTIVVLFNGTPYEVTTFRTESEYKDFRRPSEVQFIRSLEEDLKRRDFTMNAIAMNKDGKFIDPFAGRKAIENKVITTVGNANERFHEDALRMMRAVRFYSQLGFTIDQTTYHALAESSHLLENIAVERKLAEFEKLLTGNNRVNAIQVLINTGIYRYLPGLDSSEEGLLNACQFESAPLSLEEMWGLLINQIGIPQEEIDDFLKSWKLPVKKIKHIKLLLTWLAYRMDAEWTEETLYQAGKQAVFETERLFNLLHKFEVNLHINGLLERYSRLPIKHRSELQVTGNDLQNWFQLKQGPWIKEKLAKAESAVVNREIANDKEMIRELLLGCSQS